MRLNDYMINNDYIDDKIYIIIVNYNKYELTVECINSIKENIYQNYKIIIVDNNSGNNSYRILTEKFGNDEKILILKSKKNNGFAAGNNIGIQYALKSGAEYILLLNNDTEVDKNFLYELVKTSKKHNNCVVCPLIYNYYNNEIWYSGGYFNRKKAIVENRITDIETEINFATGCCVLIPTLIVKQIGLLDEIYFMYCEDSDYSIRIINSGNKIFYNPKSIIYHKIGKTSGGKESISSIYYNNRNRFYLIKKYKLGVPAILYTTCTRFVKATIGQLKNKNNKIIFKAYKDFISNKMGKTL